MSDLGHDPIPRAQDIPNTMEGYTDQEKTAALAARERLAALAEEQRQKEQAAAKKKRNKIIGGVVAGTLVGGGVVAGTVKALSGSSTPDRAPSASAPAVPGPSPVETPAPADTGLEGLNTTAYETYLDRQSPDTLADASEDQIYEAYKMPTTIFKEGEIEQGYPTAFLAAMTNVLRTGMTSKELKEYNAYMGTEGNYSTYEAAMVPRFEVAFKSLTGKEPNEAAVKLYKTNLLEYERWKHYVDAGTLPHDEVPTLALNPTMSKDQTAQIKEKEDGSFDASLLVLLTTPDNEKAKNKIAADPSNQAVALSARWDLEGVHTTSDNRVVTESINNSN